MALAPNAVGPNLGAELLLDAEARPGVESMRAGLLQAGPLAAAGVLANGASVVLTVALARLLSPHSYGVLNQLTGLYLILSMPGSAVVVAVVRRVTVWHEDGTGHLVRRWAGRVHRQCTLVVLVWAVIVFTSRARRGRAAQPAERHRHRGHPHRRRLLRPALARPGPPPGPPGLPAAGGQPPGGDGRPRRRRARRWSRAGFGPSGAAVGVLIGEVVGGGPRPLGGGAGLVGRAGAPPAGRRQLGGGGPPRRAARRPAVRAAHGRDRPGRGLGVLSMVAVLQNIDVLVVGRDNPSHSGAYAAVSVTSKAIVFGAVVLGGYLLPEAAIRWRQGGHALRQLAVVLVLLAVPSVLLLGVARGRAGAAPPGRLPPRLHVGGRRARAPGARHDHAERLGGPDHVPARRRPALGGGRAGGRRRRRSRWPSWPCTGPRGRPRWWTWRSRRGCCS